MVVGSGLVVGPGLIVEPEFVVEPGLVVKPGLTVGPGLVVEPGLVVVVVQPELVVGLCIHEARVAQLYMGPGLVWDQSWL